MCSVHKYKKYEGDEVEEIEFFFPIRSERVIRDRRDFFTFFNDSEFIRWFRISKQSALLVLEKIVHIRSPPSKRNNAIPAEVRLPLTLRFYATGSMLLTVGDSSGVSEASASALIWLVTRTICNLRFQYIKMPANEEEIRQSQSIAKMPFVIGAIDCSHARIQSPGGDDAEVFRNRKGYFSYNVQTISDAKLRTIDIVARWPGSCHDLTIFSNLRVRARFERGDFGNAALLADSGYQNRSYLLLPLDTVRFQAEYLYNESQIRTRNVVERQYGVWKRRFPVLRLELRLKRERIQGVIAATAVLHNIALNDNLPPVEDMLELQQEEPVFEVIPPQDSHGESNARRDTLIGNHFPKLSQV